MQIATGKGALGQLQLELGLPSYGVDLLVLGILGYSLAGAFNPATYSESNQRDVKKRNPGQARTTDISLYLRLNDVLESVWLGNASLWLYDGYRSRALSSMCA